MLGALTYGHAKGAVEMLKRDWGKKYPSAVDRLTYYKYPYLHRKRIRTINAVERSFRDVRQKTKRIGRFKDEERALTTVWWQMKKLKRYRVGMTKETRAIPVGIKASKLDRIAA